MSKLSDTIKTAKVKAAKHFFGEDAVTDGSRVSWKHDVDENTIIIATNNVKFFKKRETYVLVVDNNKIVYLKDWQVTPIKNWDLGTNAYAVKLNRNYFKVYNLSFSFEDMSFTKEDTFDSLKEVARQQDQMNIEWKLGHYDCL